MIKIKICGITNTHDAQAVKNAGADFMGFIFYKKSPCYVTPEVACEISKMLGNSIKKVGVFVNETPENICEIKKKCSLDFIQLHGDEDVAFCKNFDAQKIIKVIRVQEATPDISQYLKIGIKYFLFDTYAKTSYGGTGKIFDWSLLRELPCEAKIFLSGGINKENVLQAIKTIKPYCVDVSSGVEEIPGKKDSKKIEEIVRMVRDS